MKKIINLVLGLVALGLVYLCYESIMEPIHFNEAKSAREAVVKERLLQIKSAQEYFKQQNNSEFCENLDTLVDFVKTAKVPFVQKEGELSDEQMDKGLTEAAAAAIVASGDAKAIAEAGLQHFRRDTTWIAITDTVFAADFVPDSMIYIPFSGGQKFELATGWVRTKSGININVMQCGAEYGTYLMGMSKREIYNLRDEAEKSNRYPGLKIGDLYDNNNNAGNWE